MRWLSLISLGTFWLVAVGFAARPNVTSLTETEFLYHGGVYPNALAVSPDGQRVGAVADGSRVAVWNAKTGLAIQSYEIESVHGLFFSRDPKTVHVVQADGAFAYDLEASKQAATGHLAWQTPAREGRSEVRMSTRVLHEGRTLLVFTEFLSGGDFFDDFGAEPFGDVPGDPFGEFGFSRTVKSGWVEVWDLERKQRVAKIARPYRDGVRTVPLSQR